MRLKDHEKKILKALIEGIKGGDSNINKSMIFHSILEPVLETLKEMDIDSHDCPKCKNGHIVNIDFGDVVVGKNTYSAFHFKEIFSHKLVGLCLNCKSFIVYE